MLWKVIVLVLGVPLAAMAFLPGIAVAAPIAAATGPLAPFTFAAIMAGNVIGGLFAKRLFGGGKKQGPQAPIDPYTKQPLAIDPKTGLNQRVVDTLWQKKPPGMEWMGDAASYTDAQTGLPAWLVKRLDLATHYGANWMSFFKDNQTFDGKLPDELEQLLNAPWGTYATDFGFGDTAPAQPNPEGVQGMEFAEEPPQVSNEGQAGATSQQPVIIDGQDPTFSTTVWGRPWEEVMRDIGTLGGGAAGAVLAGQLTGQPLPGAGVPTGPGGNMNLDPVQEPNPNNVPDYVAPPLGLTNQMPQPDITGGDPWFHGEGVGIPDIETIPSPIGGLDIRPQPPIVGQPMPVPLPGAGVPVPVPSPIGGAPTTTTPPSPTVTPPIPDIPMPNIPLGGGVAGGGGGGASFPVVGGGPLIQSLFGPIQTPQPPPSIIDFLRRMR